MYKVNILLFFIIITTKCYAQVTYGQLIFGDTISNNRGSVSVIDDQNTAYFAGTISNGIDVSDDVKLYKITSDGNFEWSFSYGNANNEFVNNMVALDDNYLIICGDVREPISGDLNGFLMKIDTNGSLIWYKTFGSDSLNEDFYGITILQNGNIAVTGFISSITGIGNDILIVRFDTDGNLIDNFVYGTALNDIGMGIVETMEGEIIISGDRMTTEGYYNAFVSKISSSNEIIWDHFIVLPINSGCKTIQSNKKGNFILSGEAANDISPEFDVLLAEIDSEGNIILLKTFPGIGVEAGYDIAEMQQGFYCITGYGYNIDTENNDILVLIADSSGTELSRKYYGAEGADLGYDIKGDSLGNYWVSGFTTVGDHVFFTLIVDHFDFPSEIYENFDVADQMNLFPNPANHYFLIEGSLKIDKVELIDLSGRVVAEFEKPIPGSKFILTDKLNAALIIVKIYSGKEIIIKKIIAGYH